MYYFKLIIYHCMHNMIESVFYDPSAECFTNWKILIGSNIKQQQELFVICIVIKTAHNMAITQDINATTCIFQNQLSKLTNCQKSINKNLEQAANSNQVRH